MFQMDLVTFYKDGREVPTTASAEHFVAFEEHFGEPFMGAMGTGKLTHLYYLAWLTSQSGIDFKEWLGTIRDVDPAKAEPTAPFGEEAQGEASQPSP